MLLLTAYEPYDDWQANTSWLVLQEVTRQLASHEGITTRLYPVDFADIKQRIAKDVGKGDVAIHLGQAPGRGCIEIEAVGINVARDRHQRGEQAVPLVADGPPAFCSTLPLGEWAASLRELGIPAEVSHHAGTYLCNAALYLSQYHGARATFLHLPMATEQVVAEGRNMPSLPLMVLTAGVLSVVRQAMGESLGARS